MEPVASVHTPNGYDIVRVLAENELLEVVRRVAYVYDASFYVWTGRFIRPHQAYSIVGTLVPNPQDAPREIG